jgi:hypothetical protein
MAKKRRDIAGESLEPEIRVNFRKPWVLVITLVIAVLILAAIYYLLV